MLESYLVSNTKKRYYGYRASLNIGDIEIEDRAAPINGDYEEGLAAGTDMSLPDDQKLAIDGQKFNKPGVLRYAIFKEQARRSPGYFGQLLGAAGVCLYDCGYLAYDGLLGRPDGDWVNQNLEVPSESDVNAIKPVLKNLIKLPFGMIVNACKLSYYTTNHHTGTSPELVTAYLKKALELFRCEFLVFFLT